MNQIIRYKNRKQLNFIVNTIPDDIIMVNDDLDSGYFYIYYVPLTNKNVCILRNLENDYTLISNLYSVGVTEFKSINFKKYMMLNRDCKINEILNG